MVLKEKDFIAISYTGRLQENDVVFDTTDEAVAKEAHMFNPKNKYGSRIVCLGQHQLLPGLDAFLIGKDVGPYTLSLSAEDAFGKKDSKKLKLVPMSVFKKQNIQPQVGLQLTIDNTFGVIKNVAGGRIIVDFNHPLSGKDVSYTLNVERIIEDPKEKLEHFISVELMAKPTVLIEKNKATITLEKNLPQELQEPLKKILLDIVPEVKDISFSG